MFYRHSKLWPKKKESASESLWDLMHVSSPEERLNMIGERLYPLVASEYPEEAAKITGMLLEMEISDLLHLLESPPALKEKTREAMDVLHPRAPTSLADAGEAPAFAATASSVDGSTPNTTLYVGDLHPDVNEVSNRYLILNSSALHSKYDTSIDLKMICVPIFKFLYF